MTPVSSGSSPIGVVGAGEARIAMDIDDRARAPRRCRARPHRCAITTPFAVGIGAAEGRREAHGGRQSGRRVAREHARGPIGRAAAARSPAAAGRPDSPPALVGRRWLGAPRAAARFSRSALMRASKASTLLAALSASPAARKVPHKIRPAATAVEGRSLRAHGSSAGAARCRGRRGTIAAPSGAAGRSQALRPQPVPASPRPRSSKYPHPCPASAD